MGEPLHFSLRPQAASSISCKCVRSLICEGGRGEGGGGRGEGGGGGHDDSLQRPAMPRRDTHKSFHVHLVQKCQIRHLIETLQTEVGGGG